MAIFSTQGGGSAGNRGGAVAHIKTAHAHAGKLPDEIAFLADYGVAINLLRDAAQRAAAEGCTPDRLVIAEGVVDEKLFYGWLADSMGVPQADAALVFPQDLAWRNALQAGVAQLADGRWLMAPRGSAIAALRRSVSTGRHPASFLIASPDLFEQMICAAFASEMADAAKLDLSRMDETLSARSGLTAGQAIFFVALVALAIAGSFIGGSLWMAACALFSVTMLIAVLLRLTCVGLAFVELARAPPLLPEDRLPVYSILVALYREAGMAEQLVDALAAIDYPAAKCDVIFLLESDDAETAAALRTQRLPPNFRMFVVPDGGPRTKPRALNFGLLVARGDLLVIFDAEDRPEADQLRKAAARFAQAPEKLACLQAALRIDNHQDSWLTRLFALDYAAQFDIYLRGLARLGLPAPLGGTSNHFRVAALRKAGGWDAWNVTEDADLGLRLARFGYRTGTLNSATWEEAPPTIPDWFPQRRRWMKGWLQTLVTHTRQPLRLWRDLGVAHAAHMLALLCAHTLGPLVGVWFTGYVIYDALAGDLLQPQENILHLFTNLFWAGLAGLGLLSLLLPTLVVMYRQGLWSCAPFLLLRPAYWLLMSGAAVCALVELYARPFHWAKTRHGLSRYRLSKARVRDPA